MFVYFSYFFSNSSFYWYFNKHCDFRWEKWLLIHVLKIRFLATLFFVQKLLGNRKPPQKFIYFSLILRLHLFFLEITFLSQIKRNIHSTDNIREQKYNETKWNHYFYTIKNKLNIVFIIKTSIHWLQLSFNCFFCRTNIFCQIVWIRTQKSLSDVFVDSNEQNKQTGIRTWKIAFEIMFLAGNKKIDVN